MKQIATLITALFLGGALFFGISFLMCYVIVDIAKLFSIPYLINFNFYQVFGAIIVLNIARMKGEKKEDKEPEDKFAQAIASTISGSLTILLIWGMCYSVKFLFL